MFDTLCALEAQIEELLEADPASFGDTFCQAQLQRLKAMLDAVAVRGAAAFDDSGAWGSSGARNASSWITIECGIARREARKRVRLGHGLRHMPVVAHALAEGLIDLEQVDVLNRARVAAPEAFARDQQLLVDSAIDESFLHFTRNLRYWVDEADPDAAEARERRKVQRRRVHLSQTFDDVWILNGTLDPIAGAIVSNELQRLEEKEFIRDWNEAQRRLGRDPTPGDLARTWQQRRADAVVEMAKRSATAPKNGKAPAPLFTVVIGEERFRRTCEMANQIIVTEGALVPYITEAMIQRVLFDAKSNKVDVGRKGRLFNKNQRTVLGLLFPECEHPYCEEPAERCQMDHIEPHAKGGETLIENGRSMCPFHNRRRNTHPDDW
jgi:hypothetical protein